ncbi:type I polyketide synthase [Actinocorallia sp. A-T 12471]|uniref:type I polyketide synthase n=1 Tax=Actinocorallia sp. A-T 12471 TaxID=3089813 RepID=UPI0029CD9919|nr:type I polyketide synthase [Actinocorallia sp. A-T 12471]MDX6741611.1 type I polyketide synthase [Actinocorallia sp. A-T 12471]
MTRVAIVGMACRYPDAASPAELFDNAVTGRRAFRRLPDVRMRLDDYWDADPSAPDKFYARTAAVIEGYTFDRVAYKIAGSTYRSTDLTHWLALDTAARALADAGFPAAEGLPRERTGVLVGNSLTGEFTRANLMRLRWPYVKRTLAAALKAEGWDDDRLADFLAGYEESYKAPFPGVDEDTLAGGLANTIAGRICNHFDLNGGGYTVDGACSSSLLSVSTACKALVDGDLDAAVAGGVDLSIDPFEIIGFAKTGALAKSEMRVYDRGSNGFWPGEGCGMVVLMRHDDAVAQGRRVYATIAGWGVSSDGRGGITRPEVGGYVLAMDRAYARAGFGPDTVELFEGHGTGTQVGDRNELTALARARAAAGDAARPAVITTVKAMIGHTKAAAGVAGLIKAAMAVHEQVLPPTLGCTDPHELLSAADGDKAQLRVLRKAESWPVDGPLRAAVTAMGFGGINTHIVVENTTPRRRRALDSRLSALAAARQDAELLLVDAVSADDLRARVARLADFVLKVSYAELGDLAAAARAELRDLPYRAAVVAASPEDAERKLHRLLDAMDSGEASMRAADGCSFGRAGDVKVGFLFPGQGSGRGSGGGALRRRFAEVDAVYRAAALPEGGDQVATAVAQPRIVTGSVAGLRALSALGIEAGVGLGHSLGELSALHWAGSLDEHAVLRLARRRGAAMSEHSEPGTMAGVGAAPERVAELIGGLPVVVAGYNGPGQTVVAGPVDAVERLGRAVRAAGLGWTPLRVSHAFHSPLVAPAAEVFARDLAAQEFAPPAAKVVSTVTGSALAEGADLPALLREQIVAPVRFAQAVAEAAADCDMFIEVGPGRVLGNLASAITDVPVVSLDTDDESLAGLLRVAGAAYTLGVPVLHEVLFDGRLVRPLEVGKEFAFFASPCETAPDVVVREVARPAKASAEAATTDGEPTVELLRRLAAERAELPAEMVGDDSRLLDDLHLSSITIGQIMNTAAQALTGAPAAQGLANFATATIRELAEALDAMAADAPDPTAAKITGAAPWARQFRIDLDPVPPPPAAPAERQGTWRVFGPETPGRAAVLAALSAAPLGDGVLVCLPADPSEVDLAAALDGAKAALGAGQGSRYVLVQPGAGASALARTLRLEAPDLRVTVVHTPDGPDAPARVVAETAATRGFSEADYGVDGVRRSPTLRALPPAQKERVMPLDRGDTLLVTGGGKGITAECALAVALETGAGLAILGRSAPEDDGELAANLARMADQGVPVHYARADVTDGAAVARAVAAAEAALGPVTGVLHGAGRNEPAAIAGLDAAALRRAFAPKLDGLAAVLGAVDADRLKLLVTFGSIIGRAGLMGEAHYAMANDLMAERTRAFGDAHPGCRAICVEWSVWSGVGMGERLEVVAALERDGVTAITPEQGVAIMRRLVTDPDTPDVVVVSGRVQDFDTLRFASPELPLLRFADRPLVRYHGVELVCETDLDAGSDLYLGDHHLDGDLLFPAVFGMEAMTQVAHAATGWDGVPAIEDAEFLRPVVIPPRGATTVRVAVTVTGEGVAEATIRSAETGFAADHFRARLVFPAGPPAEGAPEQIPDGLAPVPLDPAADLYGSVMFQGRRFHRLTGYAEAAALRVDASVEAREGVDWFSAYLPDRLLLGDPGMRDALMHGNQVCVPHATLLPLGVARIVPAPAGTVGDLRFAAAERERDGDTYVYDVAVRTPSGEVVERWEGLRLRAVRKGDGRGPWPPALLGPYAERMLADLAGVSVRVAVDPDGPDGPRPGATAARVLGRPATEADGVALAHAAGLTLAVAGAVGCAVVAAGGDGEAARLAAARACLPVGAPDPEPVPGTHDAWRVHAAGTLRVATLLTTVRDAADPIVLAVAFEEEDPS